MITLDLLLYFAAFVLAVVAAFRPTLGSVSPGWLAFACFVLAFITP